MRRIGPGPGRVALVGTVLLIGALAVFASSAGAQPARGAPATDVVPAVEVVPAAPAAGSARDSRLPLATLLANARRLIDSGRADAAWQALDARIDEYAGDPEFDYLLGLAALDSGRPGQAVLALERALIVRPGFLQARAEIARAYFAIHERENARREFETVAAQRIPDEARVVIGRYLDAIRRLDDAGRSKLTAFVELEAGYDSNVNFGSSSGLWVLADGSAVIPLGLSRPRGSAALAASAGLDWNVPIGGAWQWTVGGHTSLRRYPRAHTLDQDQYDLASGFAYRNHCHRFNMLAQAQRLQLDGAGFRNAVGALGQWQCEVTEKTRIGAYVQHFVFDFPHERARDARRNAVGLTLAHVLGGEARPIVVASLYGGTENSRRGIDTLSYDFRGLRVAFSRGLGYGWRGFAAASYESRDFDGAEPFFGVVRDDRQGELRLGGERTLSGSWSIIPTVILTRNRSNVAPNDFRRTQASLAVRYRFH